MKCKHCQQDHYTAPECETLRVRRLAALSYTRWMAALMADIRWELITQSRMRGHQ